MQYGKVRQLNVSTFNFVFLIWCLDLKGLQVTYLQHHTSFSDGRSTQLCVRRLLLLVIHE